MKKILILTLFFLSNVSFSQTILFMAGIEKDMSAENQANILRNALPESKIIVYRKNQVKKIIDDSNQYPSSKIVLFSAACRNSYEIIISTICDVWVVEPHYSSGKEIKKSIKIGFPKKQIILGPNKSRGDGIVNGCLKTPKGLNHFESLNYLSKFLKN
jgi:hypothetical protein